MDKVKVPKKVIDAFKKTFENGHFNEKYYKREYISFFKYVYNSLDEFSKIEPEVLKIISVENRTVKVFNILETYIENLFKLNNTEYIEKYHYGSLSELERTKLFKCLREGSKDIEDEVLGTTKLGKKIFNFFKPSKDAFDVKEEFDELMNDTPISNKELRFARLLNIAQNKYGNANKNNSKDIFKYIHDFTFKKDDCLKDTIDEILSDSNKNGGNKLFKDELRIDKENKVEIPGMIEFEMFMRYDWYYLFTMYFTYYDELLHITKNSFELDTLDENSDKVVEDEWGEVAYKNAKLYQESKREFEFLSLAK